MDEGSALESADKSNCNNHNELLTPEENNGKKDVVESEKKTRYPRHVFLIIGNEFCERFSYYGMRTVLVLYIRNFLGFGDDNSTAMFHAFAVLSYFFPLVGGIISDSYWGKYKTIVVLSIVYVFGHVLKTIAAIPYIPIRAMHILLSALGLFLIAIGTGGIKPCVSSFGGDQFKPGQDVYRKQFFSVFYFSINAGALLAKFIMPIFRNDITCYPGEDDPLFRECYSLAFGIPGLLMLMATIIFVAGSRQYTKYKPTGSIFTKFCKCVFSACKNRWNTKPKHRTKSHWVDYADATPRLIRDTKYVIAILIIFSPLPIFWALSEQQGSRWTLQALQMDRYWGTFLVKPEQMDTLNPFLIVTLIPLFELTLYPLLRRYNIPFSPIRRMGVGLLLAGFSFASVAILQFEIDKTLTPIPSENQFGIRIINAATCDLTFTSNNDRFDGLEMIPRTISHGSEFIEVADMDMVNLSYTDCSHSRQKHSVSIAGEPGKVIEMLIGAKAGEISHQSVLKTKQPEDGGGELYFVNGNERHFVVLLGKKRVALNANSRSSGIPMPVGRHMYEVYENRTSLSIGNSSNSIMVGEAIIKTGGIYSVIIVTSDSKSEISVIQNDGLSQIEDMNHFSVNVAWTIPQYFFLTVGEIFLSVTGLEFSYTQAPPSMKSVVTSFWLLMMSFGNVIVMIVAKMKVVQRQAHEFLLFTCLVAIAIVLFMILGRRYVPVDESEFYDEADQVNEANDDEMPLKEMDIASPAK